jgi:hypothetical protein
MYIPSIKHDNRQMPYNSMKKIIILLFLLLPVSALLAEETPTVTDSVEYRMQHQLMAFPQEKIYVQTDKAGYLSGERIWFRAHMVDALTHQPIFLSRYIYVELVSPLDDLVRRVKIRPDSIGAYSGYIDLEDDLAQGVYTIRAYTQYMRNISEDFFFRRHIQVLDPFSLQLEPLVEFEVKKNDLHVSLQFIDRQQNDTITPEVVTSKIGHNAIKTLKPNKDGVYQLDVRLSDKDKNRTLLLGLIYNGRKYNRYYTIPGDQAEYDLQFFPEGGSIIPGVISQVAFKALGTDGMGANITGTLYDSADNEILSFKSQHLGMGLFHFIPSENETYHVICWNESGNHKRFELPASQPAAYVITARNAGTQLRITHSRGREATQDKVSLLIHHKGLALFHEKWNPLKEMYSIANKDLPTGILNLLLLNSKNEVLSERLLFNFNEAEFARLEANTSAPTYKRREHISIALKLTDQDMTPISGNMAISVTDKESVLTDSTMNIISTLLLSSELRGFIEMPSSYFKDGEINKNAIEALMLTQGWRRYDIPAVLNGKIEIPEAFEPELAQRVTGKADGIFSSLKEGQITLLARLDSMVSSQVTQADEKGRFSFDMEYPEGTSILVQSLSIKGGSINTINLDQETFPKLTGSTLPLKSEAVNRHNTIQDSYLKLANEDYTQKNGIRTIMLEEFTVTAQSLDKYKESMFYSPINATGVQTAEDIDKMSVSSLKALLQRQSGLLFRGDILTTTRSELPVLFVIDNMKFEDFSSQIDNIEVTSIESIFVLRDNTSMPGFYPDNSGAVVITTKMGEYQDSSRRSTNIDEIIPLSYQQEAIFYSPSYDTPEKTESTIPDLRTTIFWKPNVQFSVEGDAVIDFYSADSPGVYQVIGEGVSHDGKLIHISKEITVESITR